jgi:hypothetical protein
MLTRALHAKEVARPHCSSWRDDGGSMGRTFDKSVGDWTMIPGPKAPEGAPNVLLVLIDDAGFGAPDTFGGAIKTPNLTRVGQMGFHYNRRISPTVPG